MFDQDTAAGFGQLLDQAGNMAGEKQNLLKENLKAPSTDEIDQMMHELRMRQNEPLMHNQKLQEKTVLSQGVEYDGEPLLHLMLDNVGTGVMIIDNDTHIVEWVNKKGLEQLKGTREQITGQTCEQLYCPIEKSEASIESQNRVIDSREYNLIRADGSHLTVLRSAERILIGGKGKILETFTEIPGRKLIEEELVRSEERYRNILDEMQDSYFEIDLSGNFTFLNKATYTNLGYTRGELIGQNFRIIAVDRDNIKTIFQTYKKVFETGEPREGFVFKVVCKDGSEGYTETSIALMKNEQDVPVGFRCMARNITERKMAEEDITKLAEIVRHSAEMVNLTTMNGRMVFLNQTASEIFGIDPEEIEHRNINIIQMIPEDLKEKVKTEVLPVLTRGDKWKGDLQYRNLKTGHLTDVHTIAFSLKDKVTGTPAYLANVSLDITERKKMEDALRESEIKYRLVVENAQEAIFIAQEGKCVFVNSISEDMIGYPKEILMSKLFTDFIHPDDRDMVVTNYIKRLQGEDFSNISKFRIVCNDGRVKWVMLNATLVSWEGKPASLNFLSDITELVLAEEELARSEEKYRSILDNMQDGYYELDLAGNYTFVNESTLNVIGYSRDELIGNNFKMIVKDEGQWNIIYQTFNKAFKTGEPNKGFAFNIIRKDGSEAYVETSISLLKNDNGNPVGFSCVGRDVTEKKLAEEKIRESEELFRRMLEDAPDGIYISDLEGTFILGNRRCEEIIGYNREELIGKNFLNLNLLPENRIVQAAELLQKNVEGKPTGPDELELVRKDGSIIPVEINTCLVQRFGQTVVLAFVRDITERKRAEGEIARSEERYRNILGNMQDSYFELDLSGNFTFMNEATANGLGYTRDEIIGRSFRTISTSEDEINNMFAAYHQVFMTGEPNKGFAFKILRKDGTKIYAETSIALLRDECGKPVGFSSVSRDVTEKKVAEQKIRESEERYRLLSEHTTDSVWIMDMDLKTTYHSPSVEKIRGFTAMEMMGMPLERNITPASLEVVSEMISRELPLIQSNPDYNPVLTLDVEFYCKDGTTKWAESKFSVIRDANDNAVSVLAEARDITERKHAEDALRESEEKLRAVLDETPFPTAVADLKSDKIYFWSHSASNLFGNTPSTASEWYQVAFPDPDYRCDAIGRWGSFLKAARRSHQTVNAGEYKINCSDGSVCICEIYATFLADRLIVTFNNITERKRAEEELWENRESLRALLENAMDLITIMDINGVIRYESPSSRSVLGYDPEELVGENVLDYIHPDDLAKAAEALSNENPNSDIVFIELRFRRKDGSWRTLEAFGRDLRNNPAINGIIINSRDITERKQADEEREKLNTQLDQARKMESVGRLAGGVAHDFNNMLGVILGHAELAIMRSDSGSPMYHDLEQIRKAAERSADLTRQLLAFARKQTVAPKVLDLNETVESMLKMLRRLIGEEIDLIWKPGKNLSQIKIDPSQIDQILANLCINAHDAIAGVGNINIETENAIVDESYCLNHANVVPGEYVLLAVSDNGCGMDKKTMENIFEPFFTTKPMGEGTGLGLATVYGIVNQNKGFINVYSEPGHGTTFKIYLPRHVSESGELQTKDAEAPIMRGQETILLVEDNQAILELTTTMLQQLGYTGLAASGAEEAILLAQEHPSDIHLLLTDVIMPRMNGRDLSKSLLSLHPNLKCLFMSGYTADVIAQHGVLDKDVHFIHKPFSMQELAVKLREVLDSKR